MRAHVLWNPKQRPPQPTCRVAIVACARDESNKVDRVRQHVSLPACPFKKTPTWTIPFSLHDELVPSKGQIGLIVRPDDHGHVALGRPCGPFSRRRHNTSHTVYSVVQFKHNEYGAAHTITFQLLVKL
jgi:hypothetical protein